MPGAALYAAYPRRQQTGRSSVVSSGDLKQVRPTRILGDDDRRRRSSRCLRSAQHHRDRPGKRLSASAIELLHRAYLTAVAIFPDGPAHADDPTADDRLPA